MSKHTLPGQWGLDEDGLPIINSNGDYLVFHSPWREEAFDDSPEAKANWARIVMCVNACLGMPDMKPGSVKRIVEALKEAETLLDDVADYMIHASDTLERVQQTLREIGEG